MFSASICCFKHIVKSTTQSIVIREIVRKHPCPINEIGYFFCFIIYYRIVMIPCSTISVCMISIISQLASFHRRLNSGISTFTHIEHFFRVALFIISLNKSCISLYIITLTINIKTNDICLAFS